MNNEIFDRLERLMKSLMLSVEEGSYTRAEMKAYSAGIALAAQKLEDIFNNLFADTASVSGLAMFLSLIGEKPAASQEASRRLITSAISAGRKALTGSEFDKILSSMGCTYSVSGNEILLKLNSSFNRNVLDMIIKLIRDYVPCSSVLTTAGNGRTFAEWDSLALHWFELDSINLPFSIIEKL